MLQSGGWYSRRRLLRGRHPGKRQLLDFVSLLFYCSRRCLIHTVGGEFQTHFVFEYLPQRVPQSRIFHNSRGRENPFNEGWRSLPNGGNRLVARASRVRVENSVIPATAASRVSWIVTNHIEDGPHRAHAKGLSVLWHKKNMAALFDPNFVNKLREAGSARQVQGSAGLAPMPVAAGDEQLLPQAGQFDNGVVFGSATSGIELKSVQELAVLPQESSKNLVVPWLPDAAQVPDGMVKDDQNIRALVQPR